LFHFPSNPLDSIASANRFDLSNVFENNGIITGKYVLKKFKLLKFNPLAFCAFIIFIVSSLTKGKSLKDSINMRASSLGKKVKLSNNSFIDVVETKAKTNESTTNNLSDMVIPNIKPSKLNLNGTYVKVLRTIMKKQIVKIGFIHSNNFE
jgi:hypothetical protein